MDVVAALIAKIELHYSSAYTEHPVGDDGEEVAFGGDVGDYVVVATVSAVVVRQVEISSEEVDDEGAKTGERRTADTEMLPTVADNASAKTGVPGCLDWSQGLRTQDCCSRRWE